jgi:hypothetical protein
MHRGYLLTLVALLTFVFGGINAAVANAAIDNGVANGFTISPVLSEVTVARGQSQTVPITVSNPTSTTLIAQPIVNDFVASSDESGTPNLILKNNVPLPTNNFKSLVGNVPTTTLGPDKTATVDVTISVPENALSGGYYGAVRFVPGNTGSISNVGLTASVGSLFLVTVPGNLTTKLTLVQMSAADASGNPSSFFTNGKLTALIRLENTGNIYTAPFGTVVVKDTWGHIISTTQFNNAQPASNILPQSTRKFLVNLPDKNYLGHYTIITSIGYGSQGNTLIVSRASFWYIPIWLQIVALIVIIVIVAVIYWIVHAIRTRRFSSKK